MIRKDLAAQHKTLLAFKLAGSIRHGFTTTAAGKNVENYVDCRQVLQSTKWLRIAAAAMGQMLSRSEFVPNPYCPVGIPTMGFALTIGLSYELESSTFGHVRASSKDHGDRGRVVLPPRTSRLCPSPAGVVVIDDVLTSGKTALSAIRALRDEGHKASVAAFVVDREEGGADFLRREGVTTLALYSLRGLLILGESPENYMPPDLPEVNCD